jgi:hypothetical protein
MVYRKSVLAGVGAVMLAALIYCLFLFGVLFLKSMADSDGGVTFSVAAVHVHPLPTLGAALLIFGAGFYWQYRRAR